MFLERVPRVLFICRGNMERSQMAEGYYNHLSGTKNAISAGVIDISDWYPHPPDTTIELMKEDGIDISQHVVKQVKREMLHGVDRIYIFCEPETVPWFIKLTLIPKVYHHIDDPFEQPQDVVRNIRNSIRQLVTSILNN